MFYRSAGQSGRLPEGMIAVLLTFLPLGCGDASGVKTLPVTGREEETGTQLDLSPRHVAPDSGSGPDGPSACFSRNPYPRPEPTPAGTDRSRSAHAPRARRG